MSGKIPKRKAKAKATPSKKHKPKAPRRHVAKPRKEEKRVIEAPVAAKAPSAPPAPEKLLILAIRLRGTFAVPHENETALHSLKLDNKFNAVLLEKNDNTVGMLRHVKDYVTWGEVKKEQIATLLRQRGELHGGMPLTDEFARKTFNEQTVNDLAGAVVQGKITLKGLRENGVKPVFRLRPPSGGFKYSAKRPFGSEGELGYRGTEISHLIIRMA
jgi:large subunit ribosomal protein L30